MDRAYRRGGEGKGRCRKRSFCDDGHQTRSRARAGKSKVQPASPTPLPATPSYTRRPLVLLHPRPLHHSIPPSRQTTTPAQSLFCTASGLRQFRRRQSCSCHRHKILSIGADSHKSTLPARPLNTPGRMAFLTSSASTNPDQHFDNIHQPSVPSQPLDDTPTATMDQETSITQKMLSAVSGSILTSLLGAPHLCTLL